MKQFKLYMVLLSALCFSFQSCLDLEPEAQLAETNLWKNPEQYKLGIVI